MKSVPWAKVRGPLAPLADGFRTELDRLGYTAASREYKVNQMAHLSRWLEGEGLGAADVDAERVGAFLRSFGATRKQSPTEWAMRPLLGWLRVEGVIGLAAVADREPLDELMDDYRDWMAADRDLAGRTMVRYEQTARRFLGGIDAVKDGWLSEVVTGGAVTTFLLAEVTRGLAPGSVQGRVAELRSLLRFLYLRGLISTALAGAVPPVPGWRDRTVPPRLAPAQVRALLDSCDRATPTGKRDYAMLMLLARLGLRAAEVAWLVLDDIDWHAGEIVVRAKARREDRLPLPADVGEALAVYLVEARVRVECRAAFLTVVAPHRPLWSTSVSQMVWRQCARAGLTPVRAHRLRHALATDLVDRGASLPEIGQVLRHRDLATTAAYAKVDHGALRELALPWPAVAG